MPQRNIIDVEVFPLGNDEDSIVFKGVNYLSFVSAGTFGIPAKIADGDVKADGLPATIVYVNPGNVSAVHAIRRS